jgi:hypothetical protein
MPEETPERSLRRVLRHHPIAPTEFPRRRSAAEIRSGPGGHAEWNCDMRHPGGGYLPPVTAEAGYRSGLAPKCLC